MVFTVGYDNSRSSGTKIDCNLEILNCFIFCHFLVRFFKSIMSGWIFLSQTNTKQRIKCLAQGHNTVTLLVVSLYHQQPFNPQSNTLPTKPLGSTILNCDPMIQTIMF